MKEIYFLFYIWATQRTRLAPRQPASLSPNVCGGCATHSPPATALITNFQAPFPPPCVPLPSPCPCTTVYAAGPGVYRPRVCVPIASMMIAPPRSVRPNLPRPTFSLYLEGGREPETQIGARHSEHTVVEGGVELRRTA